MDVPLLLWNRPHWELTGRPDMASFFELLAEYFPAATTLFAEGTAMSGDVQEFFRQAFEAGPYLPARQTIWPRPKQFRLALTGGNVERLTELARGHAEPEVLDHLFVYAGGEPLIEYPDAFAAGSPVFVSPAAGESEVRRFAAQLGLSCEWAAT